MSAGKHPGAVSPGPVPDDDALRLLEQAPGHADEARREQSILNTRVEPSGLVWRSQAVSVVVHVCAIAVVLALSFPDALITTHRATVQLVAPKLEPYKPEPPRRVPLPAIRPYVPPPQPAHTTPPVKLDVPAPPQIAEAPIARLAPVLPQPKMEAPQAPRPQIKTGVFGRPDATTPPAPPPKQVVPAGFGDPQGVRPQASAPASPLTVARLGGFDVPNASPTGQTGRGVVTQNAFGSIDGTSATPSQSGRAGSVHASGFGDGSGNAPSAGTARGGTIHAGGFDVARVAKSEPQHAAPAQPATTPPEILFKPKPVYTEEARKLKIEGQVSFEVVLEASGTVRILRLIQGLGHGLDEAAEQAARAVRFRPATRAGVPVDVNATLHITFQLT